MNRRTNAQWRELILQQRTSGLSAAEFCRRESINPKYFGVRKKQLSESVSGFVEVVTSTTSTVEPTQSMIQLRVIELEIPLNDLSKALKQFRQ